MSTIFISNTLKTNQQLNIPTKYFHYYRAKTLTAKTQYTETSLFYPTETTSAPSTRRARAPRKRRNNAATSLSLSLSRSQIKYRARPGAKIRWLSPGRPRTLYIYIYISIQEENNAGKTHLVISQAIMPKAGTPRAAARRRLLSYLTPMWAGPRDPICPKLSMIEWQIENARIQRQCSPHFSLSFSFLYLEVYLRPTALSKLAEAFGPRR